MRFGRSMRSLQEHSEAIQRLVDETRSRITHPTMDGVVLKTYLLNLFEDIDHHSMNLLVAAQELRELVDRRKN